jgi:hypothetical protein
MGEPSSVVPTSSSRISSSARSRAPSGQVHLRHRHDAPTDPEEIEDVDVLARLEHGPVVGRDHEQREVHGRRAGHHGADELLVPGHVEQAYLGVVRQPKLRVAHVEGHPPLLLFREPVGADARQLLDERRLAVVDVPGGAHDHPAHGRGVGCGGGGGRGGGHGGVGGPG